MEKKLRIEDFDLIENKSQIYYTGSIWESSNCGKFEIIGKINKFYTNPNGCITFKYFLCKFENDVVVVAGVEDIYKGKVKNPYLPLLYSVGFLGQGSAIASKDRKLLKEYYTWAGIISRCYYKNNKFSPTYKDISVCGRWHNFQLFYEDIKYLKNYKEWKNDNNKKSNWCLDKDILCAELNINPKIYSPETCMFVTIYENNLEKTNRAMLTGEIYIATRLSDNYEEEFKNQREFCRKHNYNRYYLRSIIKRFKKEYNGWTFKIKEE